MHEPSNPRDSRALAFVCQIDGEHRTIGYAVSEVLEEVHTALDSGSVLSVAGYATLLTGAGQALVSLLE